MNDLISRQAAIDAVNELTKWYWETYHETRPTTVGVIDKLMELPSAQPEIIQCKDCKYGSPNSKYGCKCYHYKLYETHEMKPEDFCSRAERREE